MNTEKPFEPYLEDIRLFINQLNTLCKNTGKNYITITPAANLEQTQPYTQAITYFFELNGNSLEIFAQQKSFFKHHGYHPLVTIDATKGQFTFCLLYTSDAADD